MAYEGTLWVLLCITVKQSLAITNGAYVETTTNADFVDCVIDKIMKGKSELGCALTCQSEGTCVTASYQPVSSICKLTGNSFVNGCRKFYSPGSVLIEKLGTYDEFTAGLRRDNPVSNCKALTNIGRRTGSYWLDFDGGSHDNAFLAFCDMDTDGGGWTLVWSYSFTNYASFNAVTNAVTPRPNWPVTAPGNVQVSREIPKIDSEFGALDFQQWKMIGEDFLVKSNINNWVACVPHIGNLVQWASGNVTCRLLKHVSPQCKNVVPYKLAFCKNGPCLKSERLYYYYDGSTAEHWPTHDPCGQNRPNQIQNVQNPRGSLLIR